MTTLVKFLTAAAAIGGLVVPAVAQAPYPPYPQPAPGQPGYGYYPPQQTYPNGQQGYGTDPISQTVNQLLGNRYNAADRNAITRCASAAVQQAAAQYGGQPYGNAYGYRDRGYGYPQQGYSNAANMRVTSITNVERRQYGLRISGLIDSRGGVAPYGNAYGYPNQGYPNQGYPNPAYPNSAYPNSGYPNSGYPDSGYAAGDLSFRCNVDYQGAVTNVRVRPANQYRGY